MSKSISLKRMINNLKIEDMNSDFAGLAWMFQVNPDSCDNPKHYEDYIRLCAIEDQIAGMGKTYLVVGDNPHDKNARIIAGYVTLKASAIIKDYDNGTKIGEPALEISELAVNKICERQQIGSLLVQFAIVQAQQLNKSYLGIKYVSLCADPRAVNFYKEKFEFMELESYSDIPREMWNRNCTPLYIRLPQLS